MHDQDRSIRVKSWTLSAVAVAACLGFFGLSAFADDKGPGLIVGTTAEGTTLSLSGGGVFHTTPNAVSEARLIPTPGSDLLAAVWSEQTPDRGLVPHYAVSFDGRTFSRVLSTSNVIQLNYAHFDPAFGEPLPDVLAADESNDLYIVQFHVQPLEAYQVGLTELGATLHAFLAHNAVIVRMLPEARDAARQLPYVRWVGRFHPAYKVDGAIWDAIVSGAPLGLKQDFSIMVFGRGMVPQQAVADRIEDLGGGVMNTAPDGFRMTVTMTLEQLLDIVRMDEVHFVDPWGPGETDMDIVRQIGGAVTVLAPAGFTGQGVRGEVFDTEVSANHPEWNGQTPLYHGPNGNAGTHGSSVYGINFSTGVVQPNATGLLPDREQGIFSFYPNSTQFGGPTTRLQQNTEASDPGGPFRSVFQTSSVGSPRTTQYTTISAETDDYLFRVDYLSTQSMSNAGLVPQTRPQAWAKNIVGVGGVSHRNTLTRDDDSSTGSTGPASDGRIKPDLTHFYDSIYTTTSGSGYTQFGGTSGATPCTSGHFGLLFQMWHEGVFPGHGGGNSVHDSRCKSTTAKAMMINTAHRYDWVNGPAANRNMWRDRQGWGMADVGELYNSRLNMIIVDEEDVLVPLGVNRYDVEVGAGEPEFAVTLVYIDTAGNPANQAQHRVNDLTLRVTAPGNVVYWGNNGLRAGNYSTSGGSPDTLNTTENVFLLDPAPGLYVVEVLGDEIVEDTHLETPALDADYGLAIRGGGLPAGFVVIATPAQQQVCAPADAVYDIEIQQFQGFNEPVVLSAIGNPAGTTVTFTDNPVIPPAMLQMIISETGSAAPGAYSIEIIGTAPSLMRSGFAGLELSTAIPGAVVLTSPPDGAVDVSRSPTLEWQASAEAIEYDVELATDPGFANIVESTTVRGLSYDVTTLLTSITQYYWHVAANNGCGTSGFSPTFTFITIEQPDYFTEEFTGDNDLDFRFIELTPDGSGDYYEVCGDETNQLPTDPAGGTRLSLSDDSFARVTPTQSVSFYGTSYNSFFVGSNGYITFGAGDRDYTESLADHFRLPRISGIFDDLNPGRGGQISWKQLSDRVAVTYLDVPEFSNTGANTFQIEMFFNGTITITWLRLDSADNIVGLSEGGGVPPDFVESDHSASPDCGPAFPLGDMNCDGGVDAGDIEPFLVALFDPAQYPILYPNCDISLGDINGDGSVNALDIEGFLNLLFP